MAKGMASATGKQSKEPDAGRTAAYLEVGRTNQKRRTRDALVNVAADLIRRGDAISVAEVADTACVSRTTAYRYFPTSEMLSAQAAVFVAGSIETQHLDDIARGSAPPDEKLDAIVVASDAMTMAHEAAFRSVLRFSMDAALTASGNTPRRPAFRKGWIEAALSDLKKDLGLQRFKRLTGVLSLFCGIEAVVVLQDIYLMKSDEALEAKRWAARQLLRAALHEAAESRATETKRKRSPKDGAQAHSSVVARR